MIQWSKIGSEKLLPKPTSV